MPDFVRVRDVDTGHEYHEVKSTVDANPTAYEVLDERVVDSREPAVFNVPDAEAAYDGKKVEELKADLEARGLPTDGKKDELVSRLADDDTKEIL